MPLTLARDDCSRWFEGSLIDAVGLAQPPPAERMRIVENQALWLSAV
jgi:putative SOS response-associated peptidase YedK